MIDPHNSQTSAPIISQSAPNIPQTELQDTFHPTSPVPLIENTTTLPFMPHSPPHDPSLPGPNLVNIVITFATQSRVLQPKIAITNAPNAPATHL